MKTKIFFDTEFVGFNKDCKLISIGLVAGDKEFYAELRHDDYFNLLLQNCSDDDHIHWINENVINRLFFRDEKSTVLYKENMFAFKGNHSFIGIHLKAWLRQFGEFEFWSKSGAFDNLLLRDLLEPKIEKCSFYNIPLQYSYRDFHEMNTWMKCRGISENQTRVFKESYKDKYDYLEHNALHDARLAQAIFNHFNKSKCQTQNKSKESRKK